MENNLFISFVCQRCLQPLCLDHTFLDVGEHRVAELSLPLFPSPEIELELQTVEYDHFIPPFSLTNSSNGSNGFTLLGDADGSSLSQHMKLAAGLFDIISGNTEINHPLCEECTDTLLDVMDKHFRMVEDDCHHYKLYLEKLNKEGDNDLLSLTKEIEYLQKEETRLFEELKSLQEEEKLVQNDITKAEQYKEDIERDEERFWRQYNKYSRDLFCLEDEYRRCAVLKE